MATGNDDDSFLDVLADQDLVAKENEAQNISSNSSGKTGEMEENELN